ncbi:Folylpolyglutamate synthase [subsurface metagenome]
MDELLAHLGNPHLKARTVHVAGSKGKGSVAAMIASALTASGYTTGLFTSPHLHFFNERMRVDGNLISDQELVVLVEKLKPEVEAVNEKATYGLLTTFEVITALGFDYFELKGTDFQVIEVGLGGRLDATNVVQPEVCIITSISFDHTEVLGNTLTEIATEKAGIIKPGSTVVISPQADEVNKVIEEACRDSQVELIRVGSDVTWQRLGFDSSRQSLKVNGRLDSYELSIPLLGQHQLDNATIAVAVLEILAKKGFHVSRDSITGGLAQVSWPGRLQVLSRRPLLVVDGAHNPDSARKLRQALEQYFDFNKAILVIGTSADKDIAGIISELLPLFDKVIATHSIHPRAMPTESVVDELRRQEVEAQATDDISIALPLALTMAGETDLICVTGSLFVVAGAIEQAEYLNLTV